MPARMRRHRRSRRVTMFQWRSMNTKATTDCRITIGATMMISERA
jgi:hypothetical protein